MNSQHASSQKASMRADQPHLSHSSVSGNAITPRHLYPDKIWSTSAYNLQPQSGNQGAKISPGKVQATAMIREQAPPCPTGTREANPSAVGNLYLDKEPTGSLCHAQSSLNQARRSRIQPSPGLPVHSIYHDKDSHRLTRLGQDCLAPTGGSTFTSRALTDLYLDKVSATSPTCTAKSHLSLPVLRVYHDKDRALPSGEDKGHISPLRRDLYHDKNQIGSMISDKGWMRRTGGSTIAPIMFAFKPFYHDKARLPAGFMNDIPGDLKGPPSGQLDRLKNTPPNARSPAFSGASCIWGSQDKWTWRTG